MLPPVDPWKAAPLPLPKAAPLPLLKAAPLPIRPWRAFSLPVNAWKSLDHLPSGWDHSLSYGHPLYGYGYSRSAVELRRRRRTAAADAEKTEAVPSPTTVSPEVLKDIFEYVSTYDVERCVQRVVCEVSAQPDIVGAQGKEVSQFMM